MLRIIGVEQTQAIQYFGSTFPVCANAQPCPDNSIPLVAGKPTVIRVYFEGAAQNVAVTGFGVKLLPDGSPSSFAFPGRADLMNVSSPPSRENELDSLNVEIPPTHSEGQWKLVLSIFEKGNPGVGQVASTQVELQFAERALLPIRLVRLRYTRSPAGAPAIDVAAPTIGDFWSMAEGFAQHILPAPLPVFCIARDSVEVFDGVYNGQNPATDTPESRGTTGSISQILAGLKAAEGLSDDVIYCGFYPADLDPTINEPSLPSGGYGGGGVFVAPSVIPGLMAHELGHALGSVHTFADPNYPHYGSLPPGTIGEVGFDALQPSAVEPNSTPPGVVPQRTDWDIMNYGQPRWISPYTYANLFRAVGAPRVHELCGVELPPWALFYPEVHKQFICCYVVGLPDEGVIGKIYGPNIKVQFPKREGPSGSVRVTVLDGQGVTLFGDTFEVTSLFEDVADIASLPESPTGPARYQFTISVPDLAGAVRLIVEYGGKVIDDIGLSAEPVAIRPRAYVVDGSMVRVEWSLPPEGEQPPVFVRASSDNGRSWTAFNVPFGATQLDLDPASLPPGEGCIVEVLAGAQLQTTSWRSERMSVPTGRDELHVLQPPRAATVADGEETTLSAVSTYGLGHGEIIWSSDRDGDLGTGGYQVVRLSPGRHLLSVRRGPSGERVSGAVVDVAAGTS
jgi:hypothetical protein